MGWWYWESRVSRQVNCKVGYRQNFSTERMLALAELALLVGLPEVAGG